MKYSKITFILSSVLGLGLLTAPVFASVRSIEQAYINSYRGRSDIPVPLRVVMPDVAPRHAGQVVEMMFVVTETGKLEEVGFRQPVDSELAEALTDAVTRWRFAPARVDGTPVARKVLLPLRIVDGEPSASDLALAMR